MSVVAERVQTRKGTRPPVALLGGLLFVLLGAIVITVLYRTVPKGNAGHGPVDALVVLGTPAGLHGEVTPMQIWRVDEAVREFRRGRSSHIVLTGGPTSHEFVEADVMAGYARSLGVPNSALFEERRSRTTLQNIAYATEVLHAHGWKTVEVISSEQHLPRTSLLLSKTDLVWRVHAAPTPGWPRTEVDIAYGEEAFGTAMLRIFGRHIEPVLHALASTQHGIGFAFRWVMYEVEGWLGM